VSDQNDPEHALEEAQPTTPASQDPATEELLPEREQVRHLVGRMFQACYSGPLPPPDMLRGYNEIVPGSAERLIRSFEKEGEHRRSCERTFLGLEGRGQIFALVIALAGITAAVILGIHGREWAAAAMVGGSLGTVVTAFVLGRGHAGSRSEEDTALDSKPRQEQEEATT
jgi:uncharacterized membrane protein